MPFVDPHDTENIFWTSALDGILDDLGIEIAPEKLDALAAAVAEAASHYGEATGAPGWGARFAEVQRERDTLAREAAKEAAERPHRMAKEEARRTGKPLEDCYGKPWLTTTSPWRDQ